MTKHDFAFVGCRLLALYWAVVATYNVASVGTAWVAWSKNGPANPNGMEGQFYFYFVPLVLYVLVAIVLWFGAGRLARFLVPTTGESGETDRLALVEIQAVAFAAVGMFVFLGALPKLGAAVYRFAQLADMDGRFETAFGAPGEIVELLLRLVLGSLLVFGARGLSGLLIRLRGAGVR